MHGEPALPPGFAHFRYVNPEAPKGGRLVQSVLGTFDTLNPFVVKGLAAQSIRSYVFGSYVFESLMTRGYDEPFTLYGLLAQTVDTDDARSFVTFALNPAATFSDGKPVTAADVVFSWQLLRDRGRPNHRLYYSKVAKAEAIDERTVRFDLSGSNDRELPMILALMPVLPKHAVNPATFEETTFEKPIGSGPYVISEVDPGRSVTFKRNPAYWGRDLAVNRGQWNFDEIRTDYYRDANAEFEAFKKGLIDVRAETDPGRWQTAYDFPALRDGRVVKEVFSTQMPKELSAFVFNTRRPVFADARVRGAITLLFDFEWLNHNFFFDLHRRSAGYFDGSELSSVGRPAGAGERALLAPYPDAVRPDVLEGQWRPPVSDGSGRDRRVLERALALLRSAGYAVTDTKLRSTRTGAPLAFEILVTTRDVERLALAFQRQLKRVGIDAHIRTVDAVQYDRRRLAYDFDMIHNVWDQSLSPGSEQSFYWSSAAADSPGTRNYMGAKNPAIDGIIAAVLRAHRRAGLVTAVRALDRVLISARYVVPLFYRPGQWVARWAYIRHPDITSAYGYLPETWWRAPE
ncbi:MAG: ABC transporter substrate-binding protein [Rhizobiales bacterium]|nr:ABC transporter substrate-binding protein [Hyphomicrobiales bacterium]